MTSYSHVCVRISCDCGVLPVPCYILQGTSGPVWKTSSAGFPDVSSGSTCTEQREGTEPQNAGHTGGRLGSLLVAVRTRGTAPSLTTHANPTHVLTYILPYFYYSLDNFLLLRYYLSTCSYSSSRAAAQNVASTAACSILKRGATLYVEVLTIPTNAGAFSLLSRPLLPPPTLLRIRLACGCPAALQRCSVLSTLSRVVVVMGRRRLHREQSSIAIAIMGNGKSGNGNPLSLRFFTHVVSL